MTHLIEERLFKIVKELDDDGLKDVFYALCRFRFTTTQLAIKTIDHYARRHKIKGHKYDVDNGTIPAFWLKAKRDSLLDRLKADTKRVEELLKVLDDGMHLPDQVPPSQQRPEAAPRSTSQSSE